MQFKMTVNMDNAAFAEYPADELRRILQELAGEIGRQGGLHNQTSLRDINGNICGSVEIEE